MLATKPLGPVVPVERALASPPERFMLTWRRPVVSTHMTTHGSAAPVLPTFSSGLPLVWAMLSRRNQPSMNNVLPLLVLAVPLVLRSSCSAPPPTPDSCTPASHRAAVPKPGLSGGNASRL